MILIKTNSVRPHVHSFSLFYGQPSERVKTFMENLPIENRKLMIIEQANSINDYLDCDYVADCVNSLKHATNLNDIIMHAIDVKAGIDYRRENLTKGIENLINELSSIQIKRLITIN